MLFSLSPSAFCVCAFITVLQIDSYYVYEIINSILKEGHLKWEICELEVKQHKYTILMLVLVNYSSNICVYTHKITHVNIAIDNVKVWNI